MSTEAKNENKTVQTPAAPVSAGVPARSAPGMGERRREMPRNSFPERRRGGRRGGREDRVRPEFDQKLLVVRRVARVVAGGRRFNFSVALVLGNHQGTVGVGIGKGADTALAIDKAVKNAKKNMIKVPLTKTMSIPHEITAKYGSARVMMMPAPEKGLIAGSAVRDVLLLAGVNDVAAKLLSGSKNKLNNARVAIEALRNLIGESASPRRTAVNAQ